MNYFKEARHHTQAAYGGYCKEARKQGFVPVPYHVFAAQEFRKAKRAVDHLHKEF